MFLYEYIHCIYMKKRALAKKTFGFEDIAADCEVCSCGNGAHVYVPKKFLKYKGTEIRVFFNCEGI